MAVTLVNSDGLEGSAPTGNVSSQAITYDFSPTSGNLMIKIGTKLRDVNWSTLSFDTNDTDVFVSDSDSLGGGYLIERFESAGSETGHTLNASSATRINTAILEFSGHDSTDPIDSASNEHESGTAVGTVTATPSQDNGLAVVVVVASEGYRWWDTGTGFTYSAGWTKVEESIADNGCVAISVATKAYTTAASMSCTVSNGDTGGDDIGHYLFFIHEASSSARRTAQY